jgi:hypothetical protein
MVSTPLAILSTRSLARSALPNAPVRRDRRRK